MRVTQQVHLWSQVTQEEKHCSSSDEADSLMADGLDILIADGLQRAEDLKSRCDENRKASTPTESNLKHIMRAFCLFDAMVVNHRLIETPHGRHSTESGRCPTAEVTRSRLTISAMCRGSKQPRRMVDLVLWYHSVASRKKTMRHAGTKTDVGICSVTVFYSFLRMFSRW